MFGWFKKKPETPKATPLDRIFNFFKEYDDAGDNKVAYEIHLWTIIQIFNVRFGSLYEYQTADFSKQGEYLQKLGNETIAATEAGKKIEAACSMFFVSYLVALNGQNLSALDSLREQATAKMQEIVNRGGRLAALRKIENAVKGSAA